MRGEGRGGLCFLGDEMKGGGVRDAEGLDDSLRAWKGRGVGMPG